VTVTDLAARLSRLEQWRAARWRDDDLYKKLPLIGERNLVEPAVVSILRYFLRPGDVAFDIGSQAGHVVQAMSGLVGPKGLVVAFEASVRTARKLLINITDANLRNVELVHSAVCDTGGQRLKLFLHNSQNNDSLFPKDVSSNSAFSENRYVYVDTIAIDDYCEKWQIIPRLLKLDIEGAEFDALRGARRLLERHLPVLLIEDFDSDPRCFDLLASVGYRCFDLITLKPLTREDRLSSREANFLFVHKDESLPPIFAKEWIEESEISSQQLIAADRPGLRVSAPLKIHRSTRYVLTWNFDSSTSFDEVNAVIGAIDYKNEMLVRYQANLGLLKSHYTKMPFESDLDEEVRLFILLGAQHADEALESVRVSRFS